MRTIAVPFRFEHGGIADTRDEDEIVRAEIENALCTGPFERVMRPTYGAGVYSLLFDVVDELVHADWRTEALAHLAEHVTIAAVVDLRISESSDAMLYNAYGAATTLYITVTYRLPPNDVQSFTFQVVDPDALTAETPMR